MKIDFTENLNSRRAAYGKQNVQRVVPSFQSKKSLDPEIIKSLNKSGKWWSRFLNYAGENQGEALNILVTSLYVLNVYHEERTDN